VLKRFDEATGLIFLLGLIFADLTFAITLGFEVMGLLEAMTTLVDFLALALARICTNLAKIVLSVPPVEVKILTQEAVLARLKLIIIILK